MKSFDFRERLEFVDWQKILENLHRLSTSFNRMSLVVLGRYTKGWSITAFSLAKVVHRLYRQNGFGYCSAYLKVCNTALLTYLGNDPDGSPRVIRMYEPRCSLTRQGIPRIILSQHRKILRKGGPEAETVARWYLTMFGFYRTFVDKRRRPNLSTIWAMGGTPEMTGEESYNKTPNLIPGEHDAEHDLIDWIQYYFPALLMARVRNVPTEITLGFDWRPTWSGGPNTNRTPFQTSVNVFRHDINHWWSEILKDLPEDLAEKRERFLYYVSSHLYPFRTFHLPVDDTEPAESNQRQTTHVEP